MDTSKLAARPGRLFAVACTVLLLAACKPSMEEIQAKHRPAVEAVLAKVRALEAPARDAATVTEDHMDLGGARIVLDGKDSNALFVALADLATPEKAAYEGPGDTHAGRIESCGEALRPDWYGSPEGADMNLQDCARAQYVFVLRPIVDQPAEVVGNDSFNPGRYEGEVLLFRLADGVQLGGFTVSARSSDEVGVAIDESGAAIDAVGRLNSDISSQVYVAIADKLRAQVPGSLPPL